MTAREPHHPSALTSNTPFAPNHTAYQLPRNLDPAQAGRPVAGGSCGVRGVMAQREDTRSSNDIISNLSRPSRSPTPRHSTTWASDTIAKEDKQRGTVGSGRGLWAVELKKRWGTDCERAGRQVPAMNVETKALIRRRQDRDGRPRTRHSPGRPKGSGESISGVVVPSLVLLDSCRTSSGLWGLVVATPSCQWPRPESLQHQGIQCPGEDGGSNSCSFETK